MRLVELVEATAAGVGRHVIDLTESLLSQGHEVHLVYSQLRSDRVFFEDIRRLSASVGFRSFQIPIQRGLGGSDVQTIRALRQYLRRRGPFDLLHCHSTKAGLIGRLGLAGNFTKRLYTPHMFFSMDLTRGVLVRRAVAALEVALSKLCHGIIVVSREEYAHAVEIGIAPTRLCLIPNGVVLNPPSPALDRDTVRRDWGVRDTDVCIGYVGRLVPAKSPETMLKSFAVLLGRTTTPARLIMVGDGPLAGVLRRLSADLGIDARVIWLGARDAKTFMHAFDVFALTSDAEGHSLAALEALARGLPIVATSVGGISESVHAGHNGFIAPVRGVPEIAAALETLVQDPELRARMGQASRIMAQNFSVDRMVDQTLALYRQVVSGVGSGSAASELKTAVPS